MRGRHGTVVVKGVDRDASACRRVADRRLTGAIGQPCDHVKPGGGPADRRLGQPLRERSDQRIPARVIHATGTAEVAVDLAALEQRRVHGLGENARDRARDSLLRRHLADEVAWNQRPPQPHPRGQRLAGRPDVGDTVRREPLERSDRVAVVAVLGVVVVLDDQRPAAPGPGNQLRATDRSQNRARGVLVRGRQRHRVDLDALQLADVETVFVDRDRDRLEPGLRDRLPYRPPPRVLDGHSGSATLAQRLPDDAHGGGRPVGDEHPLRLGDDCPHTPEILGQRDPQLTQAAARPIRQRRVGQVAHDARHRRLPLPPGKAGQVGYAAAKVVPNAARCRRRGAQRGRLLREPVGDPRPIPGTSHEITLGDQLRVRLDHDPP